MLKFRDIKNIKDNLKIWSIRYFVYSNIQNYYKYNISPLSNSQKYKITTETVYNFIRLSKLTHESFSRQLSIAGTLHLDRKSKKN